MFAEVSLCQSHAYFGSLGATGHIGGAVLDLLITSYPKISINTLVRTSELGHELVARYPNVTTIVGDLNSYAVLESMSRDADIVISKLLSTNPYSDVLMK